MEQNKNKHKINRKEFMKKLEQSFTDPNFFTKASQDFFNRIKGESFVNDGKNLIKLVNINKTFPTATKQMNVLFDNVNLSIKRGDVISLIGANGTGKTTMLDIIVGYQKPTKGTVEYDLDYVLSPTEKFGISYQRNTLLPSLTVWDYMQFVHKLYKSSTTIDDLVIFVYAFGIEKFCRMRVNELSGGQQQRLNAMLSLFHNPEILLLDELCNNLDLNIK
ncbi:MAG: ATP-binding cassette domain-containing protein [Mycoplasmataceae bacterium]|nr:ATP-binding cassette domain-containing protein [Mycoplasmataceae bacterium]